MIAYFFNRYLQHCWYLNTEKKQAAVSFVICLLFLLTACSGDDKLPGAQKAGERDPLFAGTPMFYIKRPINNADNVLTDPITFVGGGQLIMKDRAASGARETNLSNRVYSGNYDVRDLDVSFDGDYILFSMRAPQIQGADPSDQPTWNLWEYDIQSDRLYPVISDSLTAELGHDMMARYVNENADIVFASTRQAKTRAILLDELKPAYSGLDEDLQNPALNLHLLVRSNSSIRQISFNMSHDMYPAVMPSGKIVYSRWDNFTHDNVNLYEMYPDGTKNQLLYGHHSHDTGHNNSDFQFVRPYAMPNGDLRVLARPMSSAQPGGDFIIIDVDRYTDNFQSTADTNGSGPAQQSLTGGEVQTDTDLSPGGYFTAFFPLGDGTQRVLTSWQQCRAQLNGLVLPCSSDVLNDSGTTAANPAYGIWMFDLNDDTQVPIISAKSNTIFTDVVLAAERPVPLAYSLNESLDEAVNAGKIDAILRAELTDPAVEEAIIHIRNVNEFDNTVPIPEYLNWSNPSSSEFSNRRARFLRVIKGVPEPDGNTKTVADGSFGRAGAQRMKEIIGYAPIEPDGSVKVRVPANVPLMLSVTSAEGQRVDQRHQNWVWLKPGEVLECKGCHDRSSTTPHGRYDAEPTTTNPGQPMGSSYPGSNGIIVSPFATATMAEARVAADPDLMKLSPNLLYTDVWSPGGTDPAIDLSYEDMPNYILEWAEADRPANSNCSPNWNGRCRIIINYEEHIQPIWDLDRSNGGGVVFAVTNPEHTNAGTTTCTRCHSRTDSMGQPQVPAGQLELTGELDGLNGIQNRSYVELFYDDLEQTLNGGVLEDCAGVPVLDGGGNPVLDSNGDPVFDFSACTITASMSSEGAGASRFFDVFTPLIGTHRDYLQPAELRIISEWLDLGGQYYNSHFDAPDN